MNLRLVSKDPKFCFPKQIQANEFWEPYFILLISRSDYEKELFAEESLDSQQMDLNYSKITKAHRHEDKHQTMSTIPTPNQFNQLGKILRIYHIGKYGGRTLRCPRLRPPDVYAMHKSLPLGVERTYKYDDEISLL